jgi:hypothetical protein
MRKKDDTTAGRNRVMSGRIMNSGTFLLRTVHKRFAVHVPTIVQLYSEKLGIFSPKARRQRSLSM